MNRGPIDLEKQNRTKTAEPLAAGKYWVGDPCYAFSNDHPTKPNLWHEWLDDAWAGTEPNSVRLMDGRVQGMRVVASSTKYGDGSYPSSEGFSCPVDAGLIGVVHEGFLRSLMPTEVAAGESPFGMTLVDFLEPFHVQFDHESGRITIGHITIETGDWDFEDDDDDDDED